MKIVSILILKLLLISVMLLKPILVCNYLVKDSNSIAVLELTESEEDKSSETSVDSAEEIIHWDDTAWNHSPSLISNKASSEFEIDKEEHIHEVVPPPPQA